MALPTLYLQTIPVFIKYMKNFSSLLHKAEAFCDENGIKHEDLLQFRLAPDQQGLIFQVQSCSNTAKHTAQRTSGVEMPFFKDDEKTFEELQTRINLTIEALERVEPSTLAGVEDKDLIMETASKRKFYFDTKQRYVSEFAIPNFHFHLSTGYCILRHKGVKIDALDYLKDIFVAAQ